MTNNLSVGGWGPKNIFRPHPYTKMFLDPQPPTLKKFSVVVGSKNILDPQPPS